MKPHLSLKATSLCVLATLVSIVTACGQNGMWTNTVNSIWSDPTNWLDNIVANGSGNVATFSNELSAAVEVNLNSSRTVGELRFVQGAYTITNDNNDANILTLAGTSKPVIYVDSALGTPATLRQLVLAGANGFVLDGGGTLNLFKENTNLANTITGELVLSNGTIQVQGINVDADNFANTLALNSITSFTFVNGTVNLQPAVNTTPEYGNVNGSLNVPAGAVGTIVLPVRFAGAAGDNSAGPGNGLGGNLTGSGTFNVRARYVRGNVVGDWSAFTGLLDIGPSSPNADNTFRVGNPAGYANARVNFSGTTPLAFFYYRQLTTHTNMRMGVLSGENPQTFLNGSASAAFTLFYEVGALHTQPTDTATFAGVIANAAGPAGLIKRGAGTLILTGNNTYSGSTTISNGVLQIGDGASDAGAIGTGPVTNYSTLIFARGGGGNLDVPGAITGPGAITNIGIGGTLTLRGPNTYSAPTVSTAGKLVVGTASKATGAYILQDGAEGFGALMSSPGATLTISSLSYGQAGTFDVNFAAFGNPSAAVVTNTGNLALNGNVTVNVTGDNLSVGTITLLQYNSRSGSGSFAIGTVPPHVTSYTLNDDTVNKRVTLTITQTFDNTLQWIGSGSVWDLDNVANQVWRVVGSGVVTNYYDGAKVRFDDSSIGGTTVDVSTVVSPASVTVSNSSLVYRFAGVGSIGGAGTLTKNGVNKLTIVTPNTYSGLTRIDGGTVEIGDGTVDGSIGTGAVTNNGTVLFNLGVGPLTAANAIHGTGNVVVSGVGAVNLSGASTYSGGLTVRSNASFGNNNGNAAGIGGGLRVEQGIVTLNADVFNNVGQLAIITNATFLNTGTANRNIDVPVFGTNVNILFDKPNSANALITLARDVNGISGVITNQGLGGLRYNSGGGNNALGSTNAVWHLATAGGGFLQPRNASVNSLGAVTGLGTFSAQQSGNGTVTWLVGGLNTSTTFEGVISDGASFAQLARYVAVTKVGSGTWTLNNVTMSYRSSTTVSNGVMALTGSSHPDVSTNVVLVAPGVLNVTGRTDGALTLGAGTTNQVLRGDGTLQGNLVLGANGRLMPGFSIGVLNVSGSAQLGGVTTMEINRGSTPNTDRLVASSITLGGNLVVTNIGGTLAPGDTFQLFSAPTISGTFSSVTLPNLNCLSLSWNTANLAVNGTISVTGTSCISTSPTNITFSVVGNQLNLQWPASHIGWMLQGQTNSSTVGISNNWVNVPSSLATNQVFIPINASNPTVFYRLMLP